jgi:hypothetical protein
VGEPKGLLSWRRSAAPAVDTAVHGPTCMAWDRMARLPFPADVRVGDQLLWLDAGAYHLSWETRFSHGLAECWWSEGDALRCARPAETFDAWWSGAGPAPAK